MISYNIDGRPIFSKPWNAMSHHANILSQYGYVESIKKPNLFYREDKETKAVFFADMRGSNNHPIWDNPTPIVYAKFPNNMPLWKRNRLSKQELNKLPDCVIYRDDVIGIFDIWGDIKEDQYILEDGYCRICGRDYQDNGFFCSNECKKEARRIVLTQILDQSDKCYICKKIFIDLPFGGYYLSEPNRGNMDIYDLKNYLNIDIDDIENELKKEFGDIKIEANPIKHHISYRENETILVCRSCHAKIHRSNLEEFKKFKPIDKPSDKIKKSKVQKDKETNLVTTVNKADDTITNMQDRKLHIIRYRKVIPTKTYNLDDDLMKRIEIAMGVSDKHIP